MGWKANMNGMNGIKELENEETSIYNSVCIGHTTL
jgi:hypothetical protein